MPRWTRTRRRGEEALGTCCARPEELRSARQEHRVLSLLPALLRIRRTAEGSREGRVSARTGNSGWTAFRSPTQGGRYFIYRPPLGHMDRRIENVRRDPIPQGKRQRRVGRCAAKSARPSLAEAQKLRPVTVIHLAAAAAGSSVFAASARPPGGAVPVVSRSSKCSNIEVRCCSDGWEEGHGFHPTTRGGVNSGSRPRRRAVDLATGTELSFSFLSDDSNPKRLSLQIVCAQGRSQDCVFFSVRGGQPYKFL